MVTIHCPEKMPKQRQQKFIGRDRSPRVHITYEVPAAGTRILAELQFVIGVMADLSGDKRTDPPPVEERRYVEVDRAGFDEFLRNWGPNYI